MPRSLRLRLLLLVVFVAGAALAAAGLLSREAVRTEYRRLETTDRAERLTDAAAVLSAWIRATGSFRAADSVLARLRGPAQGELLLLSGDGAILGASAPEYRGAAVRADSAGRLSVELREVRGRRVLLRREVLIGAPRAAIRGPDGAVRAQLYRLPRRAALEEPRGALFVRSVNRWLLLAAAASGMLAILLALALSRAILGPVEALTRAVRAMEAGDLAQRVPVRSNDEIAALSGAFNSMAASLQRNESLRASLLSDVAHELRTPLTNLRCQIEAVEDGLAPMSEATLRSLHEETLLLARLVEDIQELAQAEAGRLPLHPEPVAAASAVRAAIAAFAAQAAERGISLTARVAPEPCVFADPARLGQVLRNLLANALLHTPEGGSVEVGAAREGALVRFSVRDSGRGITPDQLPHVFERFYRADPARARATGGAGLGLAIVKQLVLAQGGQVAATSEPGRGSTFTFTLPASPSSRPLHEHDLGSSSS